MKRRKKHTNSCLLRLLGIFAGTGFLLLCLSFGLYVLTERPALYEEDEVLAVASKGNNGIDEGKANGIAGKEEDRNQVARSEGIKENSLASGDEGEAIQATAITGEEQEEKSVGEQPVIDDDKENARKVGAGSEQKDGQKQQGETEDLDFEEVLVYDAYVLQLDEGILEQIGDSLQNGQIDYAAAISQMFSNLAFTDQVKLLNMILTKVQTIDINEVWKLIQDGVSKEDSIKLQQLVQEHFTIEELDELYSYYESIEIAEINNNDSN